MKFLSTLFFCFSCAICFSQNELNGIILDAETKEPIEFVSIFNTQDHTLSNEDGRFTFYSKQDSVFFYRIGYEKQIVTFDQIKDTLLLDKSVLELNEVVVTNAKTLWQKVKDSLKVNYCFKPYKEKFLIRSLVKKDDVIWRIQDIQGKLSRKSLYYGENMKRTKKDYVVELTNMRKLGIRSDDDNTYLIMPSLNNLFESSAGIFLTESEYEYTESTFENGKKIKLAFRTPPEEKINNVSGYYIIDKKTLAVESYYFKSVPKNAPYKKNSWLRYRDIFNEKLIFFKKNDTNNIHYVSSAKIIDQVEFTDEEKSFVKNYNLNTILVTSDNFGDFEVKSNVNEQKDIFKLKHPYNESFWQSQNQLLLTNEMQEFIKKMGQENTEFKIRSNMN